MRSDDLKDRIARFGQIGSKDAASTLLADCQKRIEELERVLATAQTAITSDSCEYDDIRRLDEAISEVLDE